MKKIAINNYDDLLNFIKRKDINFEQAREVVKQCLNVIILENNKENLIQKTENHINIFGYSTHPEQPIFLGQLSLDVKVNEIFNSYE